MTITIEKLAADIRGILDSGDTSEGRASLIPIVQVALHDRAFVAKHLPDRADGEHARAVLYEDADLGFTICGHVHDAPAHGEPHDHGTSWAIYAQAEGETEMTDWAIEVPAADGAPAKVVPTRTYTLTPGDAHFYDVGMVHSPKRDAPVRLIRIEGANLDHVTRSAIIKA